MLPFAIGEGKKGSGKIEETQQITNDDSYRRVSPQWYAHEHPGK
jgi:hypothetical protein